MYRGMTSARQQRKQISAEVRSVREVSQGLWEGNSKLGSRGVFRIACVLVVNTSDALN